MVLEKLMAYTTWSQNNLHTSRGDSSIIYLDGVTPPKRALVSRSSSSPPGGNLYAKAQHHQRLLQTIREDDSESRGDSLSSGRTSALAAFIEVVEHDLLHDSSRSSEKNSNSSSEEDSVSSRKSSMESVISTDSSDMTDVNPELEVAANPNSRSNSSSSSQEGNNNSLPKEISCAELELLKKLEEQNRLDWSVMNFYHLTTDVYPSSSSSGGSASEEEEEVDPNWLMVKASSSLLSAKKVNDDQVVVQRQIEQIFEAPVEAANTSPSPISQGPVRRRLAKAKCSRHRRTLNTMSGYFSDWAKWLTAEANPSWREAGNNSEMLLQQQQSCRNGLIETDAKSLNSLSCQSGHSRRSSETSQISITSGSISLQENTEEDAWTLWGKIINEWETWYKKKQPQLKELVRRGIPHHFRGMAWQLLCSAHESKDKAKYADYMKRQSACEKVIRRDIARTYPEHDFFKKKDGIGQEALFNVMKAYSIHDREVGYCQGSAFIVGLLLMQMPEEETFAVLVKLMQDYRMREMFKPSMAELGLCMYQLEVLVQEHIPDLYGHFQSQSIHTNLYASSWFLTLFTTSLPIHLSCRIMDCFLADGIEAIFRLALALLMLGKNELLVQDMEGVIRYFQKDMPANFEADPEGVIHLAFSIKINQKKMKKLEKEYTTMKTKEKEDEIELRRLRTENRLLRQRVDLLEQECSNLADRLIQGQVTRAEVEEQTFAIKRELAAIKQHDVDTSAELETAKDRIRKLSEIAERPPIPPPEEISLQSKEIIRQKEEMINCLQDELIKVRLREAENEESIRNLEGKVSELEEEKKKMRETVPENDVASLQEELAAAKLREAEANLALKDLKSKVAELSSMWKKHLQQKSEADNAAAGSSGASQTISVVPSTPKKLLGSFLEGNKSETARLEEELMTARLIEVENEAELQASRLKVMELETQNQVIANQLKRQAEETNRFKECLESKTSIEAKLERQVREAQRKYADLESRMKEDLMMARIREAENTQCVAELTQKISSLEYKNQEMMAEGDLANTMDQSNKIREMQDKIANLRAQVTSLSLLNAKLSKSLSMHNLATSFSSSSSSPIETPKQLSPSTSQGSSLHLNLSESLQKLHHS